MNPEDAAQLCGIIHPRYAVPMHYTFTGGPEKDKTLLKYVGTPEELLRSFQSSVAERAPETTARILAPGEPLVVKK
jgi:L-ascorbate metabolism protein UlaG (beta-lactamase superfamily)